MKHVNLILSLSIEDRRPDREGEEPARLPVSVPLIEIRTPLEDTPEKRETMIKVLLTRLLFDLYGDIPEGEENDLPFREAREARMRVLPRLEAAVKSPGPYRKEF
jgi:hypothetical protein